MTESCARYLHVSSVFSLFCKPQGEVTGESWPPQPLTRSQTHIGTSSKCFNVWYVQGFVGGGRETKSEYNLYTEAQRGCHTQLQVMGQPASGKAGIRTRVWLTAEALPPPWPPLEANVRTEAEPLLTPSLWLKLGSQTMNKRWLSAAPLASDKSREL